MVEFERITSKDNEIIRLAAALVSSAKRRREEQMFVLDGLRLCKDAVINGFDAEFFIVGDSAFNKFPDEAKLLANSAKRACIVPDSLINKISDTVNPQGFISICKIKPSKDLKIKNDGLYIALENVADPSNLGAISRTAEAFAFDGIILSSNGCDPFASKSLRASMGALLRIPVFVIADITEFLKNSSLESYAAVVKNADSVRNSSFKKGSVMVVGNEANGLTDECISACKNRVTIPMTGKAESLNVATAASILMWEMSAAE